MDKSLRSAGLTLAVALGALTTGVAGVAVTPAPTQAAAATNAAANTATTTTASAKLPAYARALQPKIQAFVKEGSIPGVFVLIRSPKLGNWTASFGAQKVGGSKPIGINERFRIGSITKSMVGTVLLQLVEEGKISLADPVSEYISGVPNGNEITIAQLMEMRSGLPNYTATTQFATAFNDTPRKVWTPQELLGLAYSKPVDFAPGKEFEYSNTNTILEGLIIQKLTGKPIQTVLKQRIFKPLGMKHTYMPARPDNTIAQPHPQGYLFGTIEEKFKTGGILPPEQQAAAKAGTLKPNDVTNWNPSWAWAAGSVISTPADLARYVKVLVGGGLLSRRMQKVRLASLQPTPDIPGYDHYGYNLLSWGPFIGHSGDIPGFNSGMYYDPARKLTVVVYATLNQTLSGGFPREELMKMIYQQLYPGGKPLQ